jgi:hypothetical protein
MHRRTFIVGTLGLTFGITPPAGAAGLVTFDAKAFAAAQDAGRPIVVFVHAPW